ncbi:hypothetical protein LXA43DRAFT_887348 [Ganoderma leucocontextum]|nr:hypothetical protein LXA43DRAFT_887348 [Ganoderma leucocontextum]
MDYYTSTQRMTEFSETAQSLAKSAFGEQMADMIEIRGLAVSTKRQRRGYGAALVDAVHAIADEQGRAVWLVTTDAVGFYEAVGYKKIRERWIGTSNPAWDGPPVPVRVVSLSPQLLTRCKSYMKTYLMIRLRW